MSNFLNYITTNKFNQIIDEALKVVKKKWNTNFPGYKVEYNDLQEHDLIPRIQKRTNLSLNEIGQKIVKAIEHVIEQDKENVFKAKTMVAVLLTKSQFRVMILINPKDKYIRVSTILSPEMKVTNALEQEINESNIDI